MKLRVRIHRQTSRVDLPGEEPSVTDLRDHIKETLLCSLQISADTEFSLSLNGSEALTDTGQTLSSCGIVSGDLICVILPESTDNTDSTMESVSSSSINTSTSANSVSSGTSSTETQRHTAEMSSSQPGSSSSVSAVSSDSEQPAAASSSCWEPMLCSEAEEGQAPLSLELLYHSAQTAGPSDAVMVAANQLMLETGFVPQGCGLKAAEMPAGWRSAGGVYKLQYVHPLCENSVVSVLALCMGPVLVINATLKVNETVDTIPKLTLNPRSYVTDLCPGDGAAAAFKDLKKLSRIFKDQLAYPLIAAARAAMSLPVAFGLAALPPELTLRILRLLDAASVVRLSSVCKHFNVATADSTLWRHLYRRDFTDSDPSRPRDSDWKQIYKRSYKHRSELRRLSHPRSLPPLPWNPPDIFPPFPPFPLPLAPPLPGIIGGAYDQRPEELPRGLLPRPRFDPISALRNPERRPQGDPRRYRPLGGRPADVRRGFI
ncbi:F-box only protein 7 isoform X2 [Labrus mixtus]|uniref:F-box only protein 7 isoform X2 n=1 Tax=Labrus mixtus TaxID=508554 RepID=UPI0029C03771|nr:F-box only protein 7 isoform X2 [Labrus mixtus]